MHTSPHQTTTGAVAGTSQHIALNLLDLSPDNVGKTARNGPKSIARLAAMILAQGLLYPLIVSIQLDAQGQPSGRFSVEAGGRRLRALQWLASTGKIFADFPIECKLVDSSKAIEVSLTENVSQEPMHPADEFAAFAELIKSGQSLELVADKFGVTVLHVQRRLKMSNVAPELLAMYREGALTLDHIMAFASVDDHERQMLVWNGLQPYARNAQAIKRRLTEDEVSINDARVLFVGLNPYLEAGGNIRKDLFSEEGDQFLTDPGLLDLLQGERLEIEAASVREEGWAWVETLPSFGYEERQHFCATPKTYLPETPENQAARTAMEAKLAELEEQLDTAGEGDDEEAYEQLDAQANLVRADIEMLKESRLDTSGVDKSVAGAVVTINGTSITVLRGMLRKSDLTAKNRNSVNGHDGDVKSTRAEVPESLMLNLSSHRTAAIQALMSTDPRVTLAVLAHKMAMSIFDKYNTSSPLKISLTQNRALLEKNAQGFSQSRAAATLDAQKQVWQERLPEDPNEWFTWLLNQPQDVVLSLIVFATAQCMDALQGRSESNDDAQHVARALTLDMADWWAPTPETYLGFVPKAKLIDMVSESCGAQEAGAMIKMKKDEAIAFASARVEGKRWLPMPLRAASPMAVMQ